MLDFKAHRAGGERHARSWLALIALICASRFALGSDVPEKPLQPAEIASLEAEVVREWNAMRIELPVRQDRSSDFRKKVRRLFAASPSFTSLELYADGLNADGTTVEPNETDKAAVLAEFAQMKSALTRDFREEPPYPPAFQGLALATQEVRGARAPAGSLFARADEVAGWARMNEALSAQMRTRGTPAVQYVVDFDGPSLAALAPVYELAKHLRRQVTVELSNHDVEDLEGATPLLLDINTAVLTAELPAYAITRHGLIAGKFTRAGFFGGACTGQLTAAEFTFGEPVDDVVLAVFATGVNIDTKRARVKVDEQVFPRFGDPINGGAITRRVTYTVDLNGDGISELRGVSRRDSEPEADDLYRMHGWFLPTPETVPVGGWEADDFDFLDANIGDRWLRLSTYHVVTCA
jgi:hypothetical protein